MLSKKVIKIISASIKWKDFEKGFKANMRSKELKNEFNILSTLRNVSKNCK